MYVCMYMYVYMYICMWSVICIWMHGLKYDCLYLYIYNTYLYDNVHAYVSI